MVGFVGLESKVIELASGVVFSFFLLVGFSERFRLSAERLDFWDFAPAFDRR